MTLVEELAAEARREGRLGLDTEFVSERRYRPLLCLVQVVVGERIEILDPLGDLDPQPLAQLLADPEIEVVLHAGNGLNDWTHPASSDQSILNSIVAGNYNAISYVDCSGGVTSGGYDPRSAVSASRIIAAAPPRGSC